MRSESPTIAGGKYGLIHPSPLAWYGMVWQGMAWHGMVKHDMVWQGMVCVDTSVTIAKTMSVIVIEDRSVARTVVLIQRFWKYHVFAERIAEVTNCNPMCQNGHIS